MFWRESILLVFLDISNASLLIAKSFRRIVTTQLFDQLFCSTCDITGKVNGIDSLQNDVVGFHWISASKGRRACKKDRYDECTTYYVRFIKNL